MYAYVLILLILFYLFFNRTTVDPPVAVAPPVIESCICEKDPIGKCLYSKPGNGDKDMATCVAHRLFSGVCKAPGCGVIRVLCTCIVDRDGKCIRSSPFVGCSMPYGKCNNPACSTQEKINLLREFSKINKNLDDNKKQYDAAIDSTAVAVTEYQAAVLKKDNNPIYQSNIISHANNLNIYRVRYMAAKEVYDKAIVAYTALSSNSVVSTVKSAFISAFDNISGFLNQR